MPDDIQIYQSDLTGPELDEALRVVKDVPQYAASAAADAETAETYGGIVQQNQAAIQAIADNLTAIQNAPGNAQAAQAAATRAEDAAAEAEQSAQQAQAAASKTYTATLTASGWTSLSGGGWQQTVTCSGMTSSVVPQPPTVQMSGTASTDLARLEALACINAIQTLSGQIRALCYEDKPTTNITISLVEVH